MRTQCFSIYLLTTAMILHHIPSFAGEAQPAKEVMEYIKDLPTPTLFKKTAKKDADFWADTAKRVGTFIKTKEPSLHSQFTQDANKISILLATVSEIYGEIIEPAKKEVSENPFGSYNVKKLETMIAPLRATEKNLSKGALKIRLSFWKNKEARTLLHEFKKAVQEAYKAVLKNADAIIKEKGLIIR